MKFKNLHKKKREGFTLIEMVIVVTILGILSGVGFMKFGSIQETSRKNADYIAAANLATAANLYLLENPDSEDTLDIEELKTKKYISSIPKPQSEKGDFTIEVVEDEGLVVSCKLDDGKEVVFYPKPEEK